MNIVIEEKQKILSSRFNEIVIGRIILCGKYSVLTEAHSEIVEIFFTVHDLWITTCSPVKLAAK